MLETILATRQISHRNPWLRFSESVVAYKKMRVMKRDLRRGNLRRPRKNWLKFASK
jgi:hypothetical protein